MSKTKKVVKETQKMFEAMKIRGAYGKTIPWMRKKRTYTRTEIVNFLQGIGKNASQAGHSAQVLLSNRESSKRGNCCGNMSNPIGHLVYNAKLIRKEKGGVKEEQRYMWAFRPVAKEAHTRYTKVSVQAEKVEIATKVKAPAKIKTATKVKSKAKAK